MQKHLTKLVRYGILTVKRWAGFRDPMRGASMVTDTLTRWGRTRGPIAPVWELDALRRARALSISELSVRANLNITTVYRVLHGLSCATPRSKRRLAAA